MKKFIIEKLFGGHDESYAKLPAYIKIMCQTNPESEAYFSSMESESISRQTVFNNIFGLGCKYEFFLIGLCNSRC